MPNKKNKVYGPDPVAMMINNVGRRVQDLGSRMDSNVRSYASLAKSGYNIAKTRGKLQNLRNRGKTIPVVSQHAKSKGKIR